MDLHLRANSRRTTRRSQRIVLVASRFNEPITKALIEGATQTLTRDGITRDHIQLIWVPGAFELPVAAASVAATMRPHAIISVGCVIKGETPQYAAIGQAVAIGLTQVSVQTGIPVTFGVIVAGSAVQARERAGGRMGNRGQEAALAALAMIDVVQQLGRLPGSRSIRSVAVS